MATLQIGDPVNVPGGMHGTVKFIGSVDGKKGTFAGVELATQFATRGKNSGDVEGKFYFHTSTAGGGIFLPVDKAEKRMSGSSTGSRNSSTKQPSIRTASVSGSPSASGARTAPRPSIVKPNFSQSMGPVPSLQQRIASPTALKAPLKRDSLARPTSPIRQQRPMSPLRKASNAPAVQTPAAAGRLQTPKTRPSIGLAKSTMAAPTTTGKMSGLRAPSYANGSPNKFSQSLRQSTTSQTPSRLRGAPSASSNTPLGPDDRFDEDDTIQEVNEPETTPTPGTRSANRSSTESAARSSLEVQRLKEQLTERDKQLEEQANSISEMERSLAELSTMMPQNNVDDEELPTDARDLRRELRDKNERIKAMHAEFDNNRADFRSTIDTLEMASTETERVYEQRVEDLLQQIQHLQERNEDVDSVAQQFKQLEELVQELEEGLEESRRAEAEARSEVEFLRGEVERSKSELRRERERAATSAALEGGSVDTYNEDFEEMKAAVMQKDDEIRGLKTIIQSLQGTTMPDRSSYGTPTTPKANGVKYHSRKGSVLSPDGQASSEALQRQISDLESLLEQRTSREEELQEEVKELRKSVTLTKWSTSALGQAKTQNRNEKHDSSGSQKTIVGQNGHQRKDSTVPDLHDNQDGRGSPLKDEFVDANDLIEEEDRKRRSADGYKTPPAAPSVSESSTNAQWCEICEESGHDILNCANMIGSSTHRDPSPQPERRSVKDIAQSFHAASDPERLAPLRKFSTERVGAPPNAPLPPPPGRTRSFADSNSGGSNRSSATPVGSTSTATPTKSSMVEGTGDQAGMLGGKTSGVINPNLWCALCERDGHESVDCPIEDAF